MALVGIDQVFWHIVCIVAVCELFLLPLQSNVSQVWHHSIGLGARHCDSSKHRGYGFYQNLALRRV